VVSDHSPSPAALKLAERGDFAGAWGGIASLQVSLPAVWTGAQARGHGVTRVARWMSTAPAELAGLADRKGAIVAGRDADLVILDPDARFTVAGARLEHRHPLTPYEGMELRGVVRQTLLRGAVIYDRGAFAAPRGRLIMR
jgi:allantoinase